MNGLSYAELRNSGYTGYLLPQGTERFLQIGEGNFLRAFADYFIDVANEKTGWDAKVVVAQPIQSGLAEQINRQEGLYTLYLRGMENGRMAEEKRVISCISRALNPYEDYQALLDCARQPSIRYLISNTTEAGIVYDGSCRFEDAPPSSFPAKLTRLLLERYETLGRENSPGLVILSCELIDNNGAALRQYVEQYTTQWELDPAFASWVEQNCLFCSTLVDRIVTGYPRDEAQALNQGNGYEDKLLDTGESFGLWVIEGPDWLGQELPFEKAGLPIKVVADHTPYKQRKVRILNGAHTTMVAAAFLSGKEIVRDCMEDKTIRSFLERALVREIIPTLTLPRRELEEFAASVLDRFQNPFIDHSLLSITLNATSKWRARVLPSVKAYVNQTGKLPVCLMFGFAAQLVLFRGVRLENGRIVGLRNGQEYTVSDEADILQFYDGLRGTDNEDYARAVCGSRQLWGENLGQIPSFCETTVRLLDRIGEAGMYQAMKECLLVK